MSPSHEAGVLHCGLDYGSDGYATVVMMSKQADGTMVVRDSFRIATGPFTHREWQHLCHEVLEGKHELSKMLIGRMALTVTHLLEQVERDLSKANKGILACETSGNSHRCAARSALEAIRDSIRDRVSR
jgi:hypothetical protein